MEQLVYYVCSLGWWHTKTHEREGLKLLAYESLRTYLLYQQEMLLEACRIFLDLHQKASTNSLPKYYSDIPGQSVGFF